MNSSIHPSKAYLLNAHGNITDKNVSFGVRQNWVSILTLSLTNCVTLPGCFSSLSPKFPPVWHGYKKNIDLTNITVRIKQDNLHKGLYTAPGTVSYCDPVIVITTGGPGQTVVNCGSLRKLPTPGESKVLVEKNSSHRENESLGENHNIWKRANILLSGHNVCGLIGKLGVTMTDSQSNSWFNSRTS